MPEQSNSNKRKAPAQPEETHDPKRPANISREELRALRQQLADARQQTTRLTRENTANATRIAQANARAEELQGRNATLQEGFDEAERRRRDASVERNTVRDRVAQLEAEQIAREEEHRQELQRAGGAPAAQQPVQQGFDVAALATAIGEGSRRLETALTTAGQTLTTSTTQMTNAVTALEARMAAPPPERQPLPLDLQPQAHAGAAVQPAAGPVLADHVGPNAEPFPRIQRHAYTLQHAVHEYEQANPPDPANPQNSLQNRPQIAVEWSPYDTPFAVQPAVPIDGTPAAANYARLGAFTDGKIWYIAAGSDLRRFQAELDYTKPKIIQIPPLANQQLAAVRQHYADHTQNNAVPEHADNRFVFDVNINDEKTALQDYQLKVRNVVRWKFNNARNRTWRTDKEYYTHDPAIALRASGRWPVLESEQGQRFADISRSRERPAIQASNRRWQAPRNVHVSR